MTLKPESETSSGVQTPSLYTARFVTKQQGVAEVTRRSSSCFADFCREYQTQLLSAVVHPRLADGTPAVRGRSYLTICLRVDSDDGGVFEQFNRAAKKAGSSLGVEFLFTEKLEHETAGLLRTKIV